PACAELFVGHAEHRAVAHAVHADQRVLDLRGIDVDAARDHHVALAVAQEERAVGVEVADIADADEAVAAGFGPGLGLAVVVEIRHRHLPHEDLAGLVHNTQSAARAENTEHTAFERAA